MPCTLPKIKLTAAIPASTPLATGKRAPPKVRSEPPNATSSNTTMATPPARASRSTSDLIWVREATAKLPEPETTSLSSGGFRLSKRSRMVARVFSWASRSDPSARVVAMRTARPPSRETHTPPSLRGPCAGSMASAMRTVSPVGSRRITGLSMAPAGVPKSEVVSSMAMRSPSTVKRCTSTAGLSA